MNICIVTVYDSINSGSYLQAYALGEKLKDMGHNVYYYKRRHDAGASSSKRVQIMTILRLFKKLRFYDIIMYLKSLLNFRKCVKRLRIIDEKKEEFKNIDYFVLGSDTIWNLEEEHFSTHREVFWGEIFDGKPVITYAGSVGDTPPEKIVNDTALSDAVKKWKRISARDQYTIQILEMITDFDIKKVCDPTFLPDQSEYSTLCCNKAEKKKYIFLYLFTPLSKTQEKEIKEYAANEKLLIVNGTYRECASFADVQVVNCPQFFLEYIKNAQYVITNTFHGTAFSAILRKEFVVVDRRMNKVRQLLEDLGLSDRLVDAESSIVGKLTSLVTYNEDKMGKYRETSLNFLEEALRGD